MNQFAAKFKLIFIPFVVISLLAITVYTFLNWLIFVKLGLFTVNDLFPDFVGPAVVMLIIVLLWVKPRLALLNMATKKRSDPISFSLFISFMAMTVPCIVAQSYMETATGKLTVLEHISGLSKQPLTKYYEVTHFHTDKRFARYKVIFDVSGKHNESFNMNIYAVSPVLDTADVLPPVNSKQLNLKGGYKYALIVLNGMPVTPQQVQRVNPDWVQSIDVLNGVAGSKLYGDAGRNGVLQITLKKQYKAGDVSREIIEPPTVAFIKEPAAWITNRYSQTISNKLSDSEKQARYKTFADESQHDFDAKNLTEFVYLDRIGPSDLKNSYIAAVRSKDSVSKAEPIILSPVNEPFETRNGSKLGWVFASFGIGCSILLMIMAYWPLKGDQERVVRKSADPFGLKIIGEAVIPRPGFFSTAIIIDINLLLFILMACSGLGFISFNVPGLIAWGGNIRPLVQSGQYWRLLTNMFLHGGIMHILFNMYGLLFVGIFLEPLLGAGRFTILYLLTGIIASVASIWWHPATVSVGASGAIFGMYGVFLALLSTNLFPPEFKKPFLINVVIFVGLNLLNGLAGGIDNAAHIGGLLSGILIGYTLYPSLKQRARQAEAEQETQQMLDELSGKDHSSD